MHWNILPGRQRSDASASCVPAVHATAVQARTTWLPPIRIQLCLNAHHKYAKPTQSASLSCNRLSQALAALDQLRRLQLWRNLTLHAYHGTDSLRQQQTAAVRQFAQLMQLVGKASWLGIWSVCGRR